MAACPAHPAAEAVGTCARCGQFYCEAEQLLLDEKAYCGACGRRPDVDWLGHFYRPLEGKRSGLVWFLALGGLGFVAVGAQGLAAAHHALGVGLCLYGLMGAATFSGRPVTRWLLLGAAGLAGGGFALGLEHPAGLLLTLPLAGLAGTTWTDVRTRLFFRQAVPRKALARHYQREGSNALAITASRLALLSFIVPGLGLLTLGLGVLALSRVDPLAMPPVGNRSAALGAIFFSVVTCAFWASVFRVNLPL